MKAKSKIFIVVIAALALTLGTITVYAATGGEGPSLFKMNDGVGSYSVDGGETWTEGTPENFHSRELEGGGSISWVGGHEPPALGDGADSFGAKVEDGKTFYTADGGITWSETPPEGVTVNPDGGTSYSKR